ncbi:MAG: thioesterase family protein [Bdellovibrionota bacterium]
MTQLPLTDFVGRVVTSSERVQFSQVDPYGHLNASRYSEFFVNHRITAVEDQLQVSTVDLAKNLNVGFFVARLDIRYLAPCFLGEICEIASWVQTLSDGGFDLHITLIGLKNRKVRASGVMEIKTVDASTGKPVRCPAALPSRATTNVLAERPTSTEYLATLQTSPRFA